MPRHLGGQARFVAGLNADGAIDSWWARLIAGAFMTNSQGTPMVVPKKIRMPQVSYQKDSRVVNRLSKPPPNACRRS